MAVFESVRDALAGEPGAVWQRDLALSLAEAMDDKPNASTAKELRAVMAELGVSGAIPAAKGDVVDDLDAKRAARRAARSAAGS